MEKGFLVCGFIYFTLYISAKRVIAGNNDLFSLYASSHSMPNLSVTIHADHHQGKSWSNGASESEEGASSTADPTGASSSPPLISEKEKEATAAAAANGYNVFGSNVSLSPTATDPLNAKKLSELDNLLFPRIQDKQGRAAAAAAAAANAKRGRRTPSVVSFAEKTVEQLNQERMKNKKTLLSHYFEDGKRRVDYVIVFNKPTTTNPKSEEMLHFEQRSIFEVS